MDQTSTHGTASPAANCPSGVNGRRVAVTLAAWMVLSVLLTAGATAVLLALGRRSDLWAAWLASLAIGLLAAAVSLAPVIPGILAGAQWAAYGYLAGSVVRVLMALLGCVAMVLVVRTPPVATLMLVLPLYFIQVLVEAIVLARAFWPRGSETQTPRVSP